MASWPTKDPNEVLDYIVNWVDRLEDGETIFTSAFTVVEGDVEIGATEINGAITLVWLSGGTAGVSCLILNRITTSAGRTYDVSTRLRVRER